MNSGSFFCLDHETSKIEEGIAIFDYVDLPDRSDGNNIVEYPVRLTISPNRVKFYVHFFDENGTPRHMEEVILELPYLTKDNESLSSTIKTIYNTAFPQIDHLGDLVDARYSERDNSTYEELRKSRINLDTYSSLYIWGLLDEQENYQMKDKSDASVTRFLRKLLLDFMFDLMHSDVFESSKFYTQMREGLLSDFFFSSIVKKSEYYYYRRLIRRKCEDDDVLSKIEGLNKYVKELRKIERKRRNKIDRIERCPLKKRYDKQNEISKINDEYAKNKAELVDAKKEYTAIVQRLTALYAENFDRAEKEWIEMIMNPLSEKHFSYTPEWYENIIPRKKHDGFSVSDSWFVDPEEEMERIIFPSVEDVPQNEGEHKKDYHYLNSFELYHLIGTGDDSSVISRESKVSKWFYRRFAFWDAFRLHFFYLGNAVIVGLLFAMSVCSLAFSSFWTCPRNFALLPASLAFSFFVAGIYYLILVKRAKKQEKIDELLVKNRRERESLRSFRFALVFLVAWAFLYCYESPYLCVLILKLVVFIGIPILLLCIRPRPHILHNIHLFVPRLVASITAAWIVLVIGNDLFKEQLSWPLRIILLLVVCLFVCYENNKTLLCVPTWRKVVRALQLLVISFSISLMVGLLAIDILAPSIPISGQETVYHWTFLQGNSGSTLDIYPKLLSQFSFLAMFIGVFIQMTFEEKIITEM